MQSIDQIVPHYTGPKWNINYSDVYAAASNAFHFQVPFLVKFISFCIIVVLLLAFVRLIFKLREINMMTPPDMMTGAEKTAATPGEASTTMASSPYTARWAEVLRHIDSTKEAEWRFAIMEADKLMDQVLKIANFPGETLGEKLMNATPEQLQSLDGLWQAHKIRNQIAHGVNFTLRYADARHALELYEKALQELQAI